MSKRSIKMVEDSKANRYFFYSKDSSIFYDEVSNSGDNKNTILITQINDGFAVSIDKDDTIYLTCNSRYKGILLFSYSGDGWKFESVINAHNSTNMHIMDMIVQNGSYIYSFQKNYLSIYTMFITYKKTSGKMLRILIMPGIKTAFQRFIRKT